MKKYDTRQWRIRKDKADMTADSEESYINSDNGGSDYLIKGLDYKKKGDISYLPKSEQKIIQKQRGKALEQGSFKYIAPLKGTKATITVDDYLYHTHERKQTECPVEMWERDPLSRQIKYPSTKCEFIF